MFLFNFLQDKLKRIRNMINTLFVTSECYIHFHIMQRNIIFTVKLYAPIITN